MVDLEERNSFGPGFESRSGLHFYHKLQQVMSPTLLYVSVGIASGEMKSLVVGSTGDSFPRTRECSQSSWGVREGGAVEIGM